MAHRASLRLCEKAACARHAYDGLKLCDRDSSLSSKLFVGDRARGGHMVQDAQTHEPADACQYLVLFKLVTGSDESHAYVTYIARKLFEEFFRICAQLKEP
jgi:hypothetical protein